MLKKIMALVRKVRSRHEPQISSGELNTIFQDMYSSFKQLLESNSVLLNIIVDMNEMLKGHKLFGMTYIRSQSAQAVFHTMRMVKSLNTLSRDRHLALFQVLETISTRISRCIEEKKSVPVKDLILPYNRISKDMVDWVGGKNANLGELCSGLHLPVPRGFAITTLGHAVFFQENDLDNEISKIKMEMDPEDLDTVNRASSRIQELIVSAEVPEVLEKAILEAYDRFIVAGRSMAAGLPSVALRSSAIGEDSEFSFAGQYLTCLNLKKEKLIHTYKRIIASLYNSRAMIYRITNGIRDADSAMSVSCLEMVDPKASGVIYSRSPLNPAEEIILINAVWGLGPYAVDGTINPDTYVLSRQEKPALIRRKISEKKIQLALSSGADGVVQKPVEPERQTLPCLTEEWAKTLALYAMKVEAYYHIPQDIEWALGCNGEMYILQARPLHFSKVGDEVKIPRIEGCSVLLESGTPVNPGIGHGPVYRAEKEDDLRNFPDQGVLVAEKSDPQFVVVMPRASAILTDAGSITGHMASLAREYNVPSILGCKNATRVLSPGAMVTVDAFSGRVYEGKVEALVRLERPRKTSMENTPVFQTLKEVAGFITPLNLTDPKSSEFSPSHCRTLHDITRFVHEVSYLAMFQISDYISDHGSCSMKFRSRLPIDLHVIDLGGGIAGDPACWTSISVDQVASTPFKALLKGMLHDGLRWNQPRPIDWGGLMSVMTEQLVNPGHNADRFGNRSYAIISDHYLNFSSRVGYHFAVLDAYCGETINKNYVTFSFKGGAADDVRRNRRVRAIAQILESIGFYVQVKGDRVFSRFQKDVREVVAEKLEAMGRLIIFTRQMDMLMVNDQCVDLFAQCFMEEDYTLDRLMNMIQSGPKDDQKA